MLLLGILISSPTHTAEVKLPDLGLSASSVFSPELDRRIGAAFMRQVRANMRVVDEPELQAYVRTLGLNLASRSHSPELRFHFFLVDNLTWRIKAAPMRRSSSGENTELALRPRSGSLTSAVWVGDEINIPSSSTSSGSGRGAELIRRFTILSGCLRRTAAAVQPVVLINGWGKRSGQ